MKKTVAVIIIFHLLFFASCSPLPGESTQGAVLPYDAGDYDEPDHNTEEYNYIRENAFLSVTTSLFPLSRRM
jgi:hypothetical protein